MPKMKVTSCKLQVASKIIRNLKIRGNYYKLIINAAAIAKIAQPGQFVNVKVSPGTEPLLRRPLGIHSVSAANLEMLYEVVGPGTRLLAQRKTGEYLDVLGPLGHGFDYLASTAHSILVAGGMGVAPLFFLAKRMKKALVLIGAKTKTQILCAQEFKKLGCAVRVATDDGSVGFKGKVTQLLSDILRRTKDEGRRTIYACGPRPMLRVISRLSREYQIPAQISLEEHLACGIGACLGCALKTKAGYQRVCQEGPVFDARQIIWD
jgi:dihydroorotate dehydrogenase electron transfer subunit